MLKSGKDSNLTTNVRTRFKMKKLALKIIAMTMVVFMLFSTTGIVVLAQTYVNYREAVAIQNDFRNNHLSAYRAAVFLDRYATVVFSNNAQFTITEYPDSYGGSFIDENNVLHITYVESREDLTRGKRYCENIVFASVSFSYNKLENILSILSDNMDFLSINVVGLNEFDNRIDISTTGCQELIVGYLENEIYNFNIESIYFSEVLAPTETTLLRGGSRISTQSGIGSLVSFFTSGYNAWDSSGRAGFVTAGHALNNPRSQLGSQRVYSNGQLVGRLNHTGLWRVQGNIDAAFVEYFPTRNTATAELRFTHANGRRDNIASTMRSSTIRAGMRVQKYGTTTGFQTGTITSAVSSVNVTGMGVFFQQVQINIRQEPGDSGAVLAHSYQNPSFPISTTTAWPVSLIGIVTFATYGTWNTAWASTAENINATFGLRTAARTTW